MQFRILLDNEDYIAFNMCYSFKSKIGKRRTIIGRFATLYFSLLALIIFYVAGASQRLIVTEAIVLGIFSIVTIFTYPARVKKALKRQVNRIATQGRLPYEHDSTLDFTEECIWEYTPSSSRRINYSDISILRDDDHIYLMTSAIQAIIVPLRCLGGMEQELISFLGTKVYS